MNLETVFTSVVYKKLVSVDLPHRTSHQHELNGVKALRDFFRAGERITLPIDWFLFRDGMETIHETGSITFYDARERSAARTGRSEWRMYYTGGLLKYGSENDVLILARTKDSKIIGMLFQKRSGWLRAAQTLFGMNEIGTTLSSLSEKQLQKLDLQFPRERILDELGIGVEIPVAPGDNELAARILADARGRGRDFPTTREMADYAQGSIEVDIAKGDETLVRWLKREEEIFRAIEKLVITEIITQGFIDSDDFVKKALSILNRRKSRMGYALMNHLDTLFRERGLRFEREKITERKSKPDFLFPGQREYRNKNFDSHLLLMLAAKSTLKERWRQILAEADRIEEKHLCTLDQTISVDQTDEIRSQKVVLVVPGELHGSFTPKQRHDLRTVDEFVGIVQRRQAGL